MNLKGKVSLITGGSGGIGSATARQLACLGSDVMITVRRINGRAAAVKDEIVSLDFITGETVVIDGGMSMRIV